MTPCAFIELGHGVDCATGTRRTSLSGSAMEVMITVLQAIALLKSRIYTCSDNVQEAQRLLPHVVALADLLARRQAYVRHKPKRELTPA